ncbi:SLC13 family permease [Nitrosomonas aestuarii]|uniref:TrkA-C domain-containing protein n=1 Tax=Nitrosomonas aestuarii TaxID=52441 RepID=A0A1I3XA26_9PROT|nr:SLC13 family permease [Nitrosomonas aestuarii]PTN12841.1 TrkA family protein [Nitrosomonas aestuarii]SFK16227.1 TrkA-C domain-containing protein [Nitrosomonas aestuarii]
MATDQWLIIGILLITAVLFLWGHWRHDLVAIGALLACVVTGLVNYSDAFIGFSHPAVITVACILILSAGLQNSGAVDWLTRWILPKKSGPVLSIVSLTCLAAILSGFMNNVGALAILIPVALQMSSRLGMAPGQILMPLAFGSILGGMTTLIGTPPNLIVSGIRAETTELGYFSMFDFTSVGLTVAIVGVLFISLIGWRLVPTRKPASYESFDLSAYLTEARVTSNSKAVGMNLHEIETVLEAADAQVVGLVRNDVRVTPASLNRKIYANDILIIEAEAESLANALSSLGLVLEEAKTKESEDAKKPDETEKHIETVEKLENDKKKSSRKTQEENKVEKPASGEIILTEYVILPASLLVNRSPQAIELRTRYGVNLLALSRKGSRITTRLRTILFQAGDVLMLQGPPDAIAEFAENTGCVPLAERTLRIPDKRKALLGGIIMMLAISAIVFGLLPPALAFMCGVLAVTALQIIPLRSVYQVIDWPVVVLLAALIPVAGAMQATGTADLIARVLLENLAQGDAVIALGLVLVVTMTLSDLMNNAATAAVMCPIALGTANQLSANPDAFLMAVAVGASCAFLTPIGHQNNTLILGPGGFRFGDYWRLGLPLEILVITISVPMLILVWPL